MRLQSKGIQAGVLLLGLVLALGVFQAQETGKNPSSYSPVVIQEDFTSIMSRMSAAKPAIMKRQMDLLEERYDVSDHPASGVAMDRTRPVQEGVRRLAVVADAVSAAAVQ